MKNKISEFLSPQIFAMKINNWIKGLKDWKCLGFFFDKISAFEQTQVWKRASSVWNLILCFTNKYWGQDRDPLFKDRYDMQDGKWFLLTRLFSLRIFQDTKTQKVVVQIKWHISADTVFKRGGIQTETLLSEIGTGFHWLICFNCWKIRKSCFWNKIILLTTHSF